MIKPSEWYGCDVDMCFCTIKLKLQWSGAWGRNSDDGGLHSDSNAY